MSSLVEVAGIGKPRWSWFIASVLAALVIGAISTDNLLRARHGVAIAHHPVNVGLATSTYPHTSVTKAKTVAQHAESLNAGVEAEAGRRIIRTSSLEMVVQHPAEVADQIALLTESLGGYLVKAEDGGEEATAATLTVRVPAAKFEQARTEIRKLGVRVEGENIDAQDVTSQYVDQDANLRNLKAEETQYLGILKQATTVKDMLAVSEKLSEVRGAIEQQQAAFNALSQQIETVAMTISLRTEAEAQIFGLNWRPGYQIKLALRDGLESVATYASAMTAILFYIPAVLLWTATILLALMAAFRLTHWIGRRWFGWKPEAAPAQS
jgi:hypothetical protein